MADEDRHALAWARRYHRSDLADTLQGTRRVLARVNALDREFAKVDGAKALMNAIVKDGLDARALLEWDTAEMQEEQRQQQQQQQQQHQSKQAVTAAAAAAAAAEKGPYLRFSVPRADRPGLDADSLLRVACTTGNRKAAALALARGARVNGCRGRAPGGPYDPPICLAVAGGHLALVEFLIKEAGAQVQRPDLLGVFPIVTATQAGNAELVELLCRQGKARASRRCPNGGTPLMMACRAGHEDVVRMLLKLGSSSELKTIEGETALVQACRNNRPKIAELLLLRGVDVNTPLRQEKFARYRLPIHEACLVGNQEVVRTIVRIIRGNDDADGLKLENSTLRKVFLMRTADGGGMTPLGLVAANGHVRCLRELFEVLPDPLIEELLQARSTDLGHAPLALAALGGHAKMVGLILRRGVRIGVKDARGMDALALAGMHGHVDVVRLLRLKEEEEREARATRAEALLREKAERAARRAAKQEKKEKQEKAEREKAKAVMVEEEEEEEKKKSAD